MTSNGITIQNPLISKKNWKDKISNYFQIGGIETSVLDNGPGRGVRIAWINTGSGLRYKLVLDRTMDIADSFYNQHCLSWINHTGVVPANYALNQGIEWLKGFGGGLMVTCGLSHIGGPESDEYGNRGLHGRISNQPAEIISIIQPDPLKDQFEMSITGIIKESSIFGPNLVLKRTISSILGEAKIRIHDEVTNNGNETVPHMILYHCNFGWPLVDEGAFIYWDGKWQPGGSLLDNEIFHEDGNYRSCLQPIDKHKGKGEAVAFIDIIPDESRMCICGLRNPELNIDLKIKFNKSQLPWLTNWQHWGKNEYVTGLEPGTNPPIGQIRARKEGNLIYLKPGECRMYDLEIELDSITD
jgi:hypothetical protein